MTDPGSLNVDRPRVSTIGTAQITQQATAEEMVDSAGNLDALPTQPSAQDASDGDSSESSDGSMSSQRADESRLAYLRRCADYLQVQNRRYLRRQRRQKSLSVLVLPTTMYGSFCVVVLILWRLTSLPAWNGCSGCAQQSIGLAVSCTAWVLTQVLSVCKQSVLATFDRGQPGPKSGRSHCSMSKSYLAILLFLACVCRAPGVRVWGSAVQQPHEAVQSVMQQVPHIANHHGLSRGTNSPITFFC